MQLSCRFSLAKRYLDEERLVIVPHDRQWPERYRPLKLDLTRALVDVFGILPTPLCSTAALVVTSWQLGSTFKLDILGVTPENYISWKLSRKLLISIMKCNNLL
jgi:hypothetical protein